MRAFDYERPASLDRTLAALGPRCRPLAGGTDLLPLLKRDLLVVDGLLDIKACGLPGGIREQDDGSVYLGALCTLADIAASPILARRAPILVEAAQLSASAQIRNRASLGGNLLQRPRCAYFRHAELQCWLKGGNSCLAAEGCATQHALYGDSPCRAVHPSDLASCLLALDARVLLRGPGGERRLPLADFFTAPSETWRRETGLADDELVLAIELPARSEGWRALYRKAMDRQAWDFALAGMALACQLESGRIRDLRVVGSGLAALPWRLPAVEEALRGTAGGAAEREAALAALAEGARPLPGSAYKLPLTRALLSEALDDLLGVQD